MALTINCECNGSLELEEYIQWVDDNVDVQDQDSLIESASKLLMLSKNRKLLTQVVDVSLKAMNSAGVQTGNKYTDSTFLLVGKYAQKRADFFVRMNVWRAPRLRGGAIQYEERLYSYALPHDHNFDFLTVGYYGPGYRTRIYEYDVNKIDGCISEHVDLRFSEETTLPEGKVMFYRHGVDIHTQIPPESLSISLNLMVQPPLELRRQQYHFDTEGRTIVRYGDGPFSRQLALLELAGEVGNGDTAEILEYVGKTHEDPRSRAAALQALRKVAPNQIERISAIVSADKSDIVRRAVI